MISLFLRRWRRRIGLRWGAPPGLPAIQGRGRIRTLPLSRFPNPLVFLGGPPETLTLNLVISP